MNNAPRLILTLCVVVAAACLTSLGHAAESASVVLLKSPEAVITRGDWESDLERIPADKREAFASSPQRVNAVLNNLLVSKTLAARARGEGLDRDPRVAAKIALETDRLLAAQMTQKIESDAGAEFDRDPKRNESRARELYLVGGGKKYSTPEQVDVSHILIRTDQRGKDEALKVAEAARAKLAAGADFSALAREVSEDKQAKSNGGHLSWMKQGMTDPAFEQAAFALKNRGDLSPPVLSTFGYHIIRLEGRKAPHPLPFDEVKVKIIEEMRGAFINEARDKQLARISSDPKLEVNQEAVDALLVRVVIPPIPPGLLTPK